jgi:light-regulated signal transduction histidine kinase (bacteriophytochrome)
MFVATVVKSTKRMRNLLSDLLAYAQIGTSREESPETDLNLVVDKVRQNLKMSIHETCASDRFGVRIWVESAPGHGSPFRFVLRNIQAQVAAPVLVETEFEERGARRSVDGPLENKNGQSSSSRLVRRTSSKEDCL